MADFATIYIQKWLSDAKQLEKKQTQQFGTIDPEKRKGKLSHSSITIDEDFVVLPDAQKSQTDKIKSDPEQQLRLKKFFKIPEDEQFIYDDICEWLNYGEFNSAQNGSPSSTPSTPDIRHSDPQEENNNNLLRGSKDAELIDIRSGKICVTSSFVLFFQGDAMKLPVDGIVKEDKVSILKHVKRVIVESTTWPSRHLVLTHCQLQIYDNLDSKKDYMVRVMVPLSDIHSVTKYIPTPDSEKKFGFQVLTSRKMFTFGCESNSEAMSWIEAIKSRLAKEEIETSFVEILLPIKSITDIAKIQHSVLYPKSVRISTTYGYQFVFSTPSFMAAYSVLNDQMKKLPQTPVEEIPVTTNVHEEFEFEDPNCSASQEFRKIFGLPETEKLINDYHCSVMMLTPLHGRMFISPNYICFRSSGIFREKKFVIPVSQITKVELLHFRHTLYFKPMKITTPDKEFIFCDLMKRKQVLNLIQRCLAGQKSIQQAVTPLISLEKISLDVSCTKHKNLNITILIIGSRGDVQPFISFALGLQKEGHRVRIASHMSHKSFVESWGINFAPLAGDPKDLMRLMVNNESMLSVSFIKEALGNFTQFIEDLLWSAWVACSDENFKPDVIIQNPPTMAGPHIAEVLKIPLFCSFTMPWSRTSSFPHPFAIPSVPCGPAYNYSSFIALEEAMFFPIREKFNVFRKKLGLSELAIGSGHSIMHDRQVPFLYCWSPSVLKKPSDWPDFIHVTGYWFLDAPLNWSPSPDLVKFINQEPKPIYIGFGSITVDDPDELTNSIISALKETGQRAVLVKGWGGLADITYPDNIFALDNVPHDWLFPQMAAVIHHGGAGTTAAGLRAGVPTLIVPFFGDQFFWGQRVAELGVGVPFLTVKQLKHSLAGALVKLTTDKEMQVKAQALGEQIRSQDGVTKAVEAFHMELNRFEERKDL